MSEEDRIELAKRRIAMACDTIREESEQLPRAYAEVLRRLRDESRKAREMIKADLA